MEKNNSYQSTQLSEWVWGNFMYEMTIITSIGFEFS